MRRVMKRKKHRERSIVFVHPDLGIGGAERLVVDAAVGLQKLGHRVVVFTSHCDPAHCFDEARDGTLDVRVRGNSVVPPNVFGRLAILCAILRQLHLIVQIALSGELAQLQPEVLFLDQLSAGIPLLKLVANNTWTLFYCHFPDQLLAQRRSLLKQIYRLPFDWVEAWTTGAADALAVNSNFTRQMFKQTFRRLKDRQPSIIYPCVDTTLAKEKSGSAATERLWKDKKVVLSLNRFERKKSVELAVKAFARLSSKRRQGVRLVVAGGYDPRMQENVSYHEELVRTAESLGLKSATVKTIVTALSVPEDIDVVFFLSVPAAAKSMLLRSARLLVYTPLNEHFGIVPLEAMSAGVPVLASNSGGPLETVLENETGWLRDINDVGQWTSVMDLVLNDMTPAELETMRAAGKRHVLEEFSEEQMASRLDATIERMTRLPKKGVLSVQAIAIGSILFGWAVLLAVYGLLRLWKLLV